MSLRPYYPGRTAIAQTLVILDLLTRLRLYGPAAYIRKHSFSETVRAKTEVSRSHDSIW